MKRLRSERIRRGMTQFDVGRAVGIHPVTIAHLEAGTVEAWPGYRKKLAELFGLSAEDLFGDTNASTEQRSSDEP